MRSVRLCFLIAFFPWVPAFADESPVTKEQFLGIMEALQNRVNNIEIVVSTKQFKIDRKTGAIQETPYYFDSRLIMSGPAGAKLRWEAEFLLEWAPGPNYKGDKVPLAPRAKRFDTFNGKIGMSREQFLEGPLKDRLTYEITGNRMSGMTLTGMGAACYLGLIAPCYEDVGLAQYLAKCERWDLIYKGNGVYSVRCPYKFPSGVPEIRELEVDLNRGGAILGCRAFDPLERGGDLRWEYRNVVLKDYGGGMWMPEYAERSGGHFEKATFSKIAVNQELPEDTFVLEVEPGAIVQDRIRNTHYTAGPSGGEDLMKYVGDALDGAKALADEPAPDAGQGAQAVEKPPAGTTTGAGNRFLVVICAALGVLVVILLAAVVVGRRRRRA